MRKQGARCSVMLRLLAHTLSYSLGYFCFLALHVIQLSDVPFSVYCLSCFPNRGVSSDSSDAGAMEGGEHSAGGSDESPSEAGFVSGRDEALMDMEDSDSVLSERLLSPGSRGDGPGHCVNPAWDLAFYEEDCFGAEVMQYAVDLGQHTGSAPCVDVKTQVGIM